MLAAQRQPGWLSRLVLEEPTILRPGVPKLDLPPRPDGPLNFDWEGIVPALFAEFNNPDPAWWERLRDITSRLLSWSALTDPVQRNDA